MTGTHREEIVVDNGAVAMQVEAIPHYKTSPLGMGGVLPQSLGSIHPGDELHIKGTLFDGQEVRVVIRTTAPEDDDARLEADVSIGGASA